MLDIYDYEIENVPYNLANRVTNLFLAVSFSEEGPDLSKFPNLKKLIYSAAYLRDLIEIVKITNFDVLTNLEFLELNSD